MSLLFDNVNDYADTSGTPPVVGYPCTISVWVQASALGSQDRIFHMGRSDGTNADAFVLRKLSTNTLQATVVAATTAETSNATTVNTLSLDTWHHCGAIFASATSRTVYLDGDATNKGTNTGSRTPTADFAKYRLGTAMDLAEDWNGYIAHVAVWDVALSEANIQSLAGGANPNTIDPTNLVWYCPLLVDESPMQDAIGSIDLTPGNDAAYSANNPAVDSEGTLYVKLIADASAASASSVQGVVLNATRDTVIGEFSGQAFEAALESGEAVLLIPLTDISPDGTTLTTSDAPIVFAYNATDGTVGEGIASVIEV